MSKLLAGKVALVTGAAFGIGRATALNFAAEGAKVVVSDVAREGEETVSLIRGAGGEAVFMRADISKANEVQALVYGAVKAFGRLDVAFNNAGIGGPQLPVSELPEEAWQKVLAVNLTGVFLCMKYELQQMEKQGGGAIVNNASILGTVAFANSSAYTASKHGVLGLTKTAALECATKNIRVNAVCPAFIQTPMLQSAGLLEPEARKALEAMHPVRRLGLPEEVARVVTFLASDQASFVTGHPMLVDGGYVAQ
ncbi:MAG: SDR family oxidoreductase [Myxococcaceae bacterium]|nr:SDR family oxidoreductase [Myxococcaceae bacterium]